jgi:hypothetical protein
MPKKKVIASARGSVLHERRGSNVQNTIELIGAA